MSGTSVLNLAIEYPGFYSSVAAYSGCAQTSDPLGQAFVRTTTEWIGGVDDITNMWGPLDGPGWVEHDPLVNAEKLRGTPIYMSTGNGLPGIPNDTFLNPRLSDGRAYTENQIIIGGPIEAATNLCTSNMAKRLYELNIPAVVDFQPVGTTRGATGRISYTNHGRSSPVRSESETTAGTFSTSQPVLLDQMREEQAGFPLYLSP